MNRDDIIELAKKAGFTQGDLTDFSDLIVHFAALVAASERERAEKAEADAKHYHQKCEMLQTAMYEAEEKADLIAAAEREECAKVCDELAALDMLSNYYKVAANAIRARGEK